MPAAVTVPPSTTINGVQTQRRTPQAPGIPYFTPLHPISPGTALNVTNETPTLFTPLKIRGVTTRNRIAVAPMCQFSTAAFSPHQGELTDYHVATLGHYALKGAGIVFIEQTAVQPNGRASPHCPGLWSDDQIAGVQRVANFVKSQGALCGIQLGHSGRKACTFPPWVAKQLGMPRARADEEFGGWPRNIVGPMGGKEHTWDGKADQPDGFYWPPRALSLEEIGEVVDDFGKAAARAVKAGVDLIEIHGAHGYLISSFLSPVANRRTDKYGGSFENRTRFLFEILKSMRSQMPDTMPLFLRISSTEWLAGTEIEKENGSWTEDTTIQLAKLLPALGVDLLDLSSGGGHPQQRVEMFESKDYQTTIAGKVRRALKEAGVPLLIGGVGMITEAEQARDLVQAEEALLNEASDAESATDSSNGHEPKADIILVGRQFMRDPQWVLNVAQKLKVDVAWPVQSWKGKPPC